MNETFFSNEAFQQAMIASSQDCIKVLDLNATLLFMNKGGMQITECDFEEIAGACWYDFWQGETQLQAKAAFEKAQKGAIGEFITAGPTAKTKTHKWWYTTLTLIHEKNGKSEWILAVSRDITALKTTEEQLQSALQSRDELLSVCGHELRTPLTSLNLQLEVAKVAFLEQGQPTIPTAEVRTMVNGFEKQINRLIRLVEDMLDVTSMKSAKLNLACEKTNLLALATDATQRLSEQLKQAKCNVSIDIHPELFGVWDPFRMEQVLINILSNAIKYGAGKPISIQANAQSDYIIFTVQDLGKGIDPACIPKIFNRYERSQGSKDSPGMGLGLYIAKRIIEAHSGEIYVESMVNHGSKFIMKLPWISNEQI